MMKNKMNLEQFEDYVTDELTGQLEAHFQNDTYFALTMDSMDGKMLTIASVDSKFAESRTSHGYIQLPSISLTGLFQMYLNGMDIEKIISKISCAFIQSLSIPVEMEDMFDYAFAKEHMFIICVNRKNNFSEIKFLPHRNISDFSLLCCISLFKFGMETIQPVTYRMLEEFGIDEEELFLDALKSTVHIKPVSIKNINDIYEEGQITFLVNGRTIEDHIKHDTGIRAVFALIQTNDMQYGATGLFYPGIMDEVSDLLQDELTLIPHSKNCFIALADRAVPYDYCEEIQKEFKLKASMNPNSLSDQIYHYSKDSGIFETMESFRQRESKPLMMLYS